MAIDRSSDQTHFIRNVCLRAHFGALFLPLILVTVACSLVAQNGAAGSTPVPSSAIAIAPIDIYQKLPFVTVELGGPNSHYLFLVDPAYSESVLNRAQAVRLGLKTAYDAPAQAEQSKKEFSEAVDLAVGGRTIRLPRMRILDLTPSFAAVGRRFDGLVGSDVFKQFVVEIDHEAQLLRLYDPAEFRYYGGGETVPLVLKAGLPYVAAKLKVKDAAETTKDYLLSFGTGDAINDDLFKKLAGPGTGAFPDLGRAEHFEIAGFEFSGMNGAAGDPLLGEEMLHRFNLTFDYTHQKLYLESNRHFNDGFIFNMSGLDLALAPDFANILIQEVFKNTPAEDSGLARGDIITEIDGQPVSGLGLERVSRMFEEPHSYTLTLQRGQSVLHRTVKLRRLM
jgi:PDZ domain-containing protein